MAAFKAPPENDFRVVQYEEENCERCHLVFGTWSFERHMSDIESVQSPGRDFVLVPGAGKCVRPQVRSHGWRPCNCTLLAIQHGSIAHGVAE